MCNPPKRCVSFPEILKTLLPHKSPDLFFHQISICVIDGLCMKLCLCVSTILKQTSSNHTVPGTVLYSNMVDFCLHQPNLAEFMGQMSLSRYNGLFWVCPSTPPLRQIKQIHTLSIHTYLYTPTHYVLYMLIHKPPCLSQSHKPKLKWSKKCPNDQRNCFFVVFKF